MSALHRILSTLFRYQCIGDDYLHRWHLIRTPWFRVYLHHFVGEDWSRDLHDHPKWFTSIGIAGSYIEETPQGRETFRAPWVRRFPPTHIHRLILAPGMTCWTLVIVGRELRQWGFWVDGEWMPWPEYAERMGRWPVS